ncbi:MAG: AtpZ/AtpI family protein [Lachnospiraceae bacterium]|nr:AtpZ/AtpI family protein [Lachnospiraceae bacterium]
MKNGGQIARSLAMITQLGISMLAPVVLCVFVGNWLDQRYGWSVTAVLLILGIMAGARNSWILLKDVSSMEPGRKKNEKDQSDSG